MELGEEVEVTYTLKNIINTIFYLDSHHQPWMLSFVYRPMEHWKIDEFWNQLERIGGQFVGSWMLMGDFNSIDDQVDKSGGRAFVSSSVKHLYQLKMEHGLIELGFKGSPFTWRNDKGGRQLIRERLDWGLANGAWQLLYPRASI